MFRRGSFTSPAVNVMLFHASAEKSDPVCDTQIATNRPNAVTADRPGTISTAPRTAHGLPKLSETAVWFQPRRTPTTISPSSAPVFAVVNTFWMIRPYSTPRVLAQGKGGRSTGPTSSVADNVSAWRVDRAI